MEDEFSDEHGREPKPGFGSGPDYWVLMLDPDDYARAKERLN
jgi:hypothetical protein